MSPLIRRIGFGSGIVLAVMQIVYLGLIATIMLTGSGFPPVEPFQTMFNIVVLLIAVWMVIFWTVLHESVPGERKLFSRTSLALIVIFATLTSINRYVGLTVVRQSILSGDTDGLQWFLPYGWPSMMLAIEVLAWGLFFGLACLWLAPVFTTTKFEHSIFWTLMVTGCFSILAALGPVIGSDILKFNPFTLAGTIAWGPGLTLAAVLIAIWFRRQ